VFRSTSVPRTEKPKGTWIVEEAGLVLEKAIISGVTHDTTEAKGVDPGRA